MKKRSDRKSPYFLNYYRQIRSHAIHSTCKIANHHSGVYSDISEHSSRAISLIACAATFSALSDEFDLRLGNWKVKNSSLSAPFLCVKYASQAHTCALGDTFTFDTQRILSVSEKGKAGKSLEKFFSLQSRGASFFFPRVIDRCARNRCICCLFFAQRSIRYMLIIQ